MSKFDRRLYHASLAIEKRLKELTPIEFSPRTEERDVAIAVLAHIEAELDRLTDLVRGGLGEVPRCSHGHFEPHSEGGKTSFNYDQAWPCNEWESKSGMFVFPWKLKESG